MSSGGDMKNARTSLGWSPAWFAHAWTAAPPERAKRILQFNLKGFGGGVPLNTETTAVKPRVGIE
jgi:hypothetical protein